MIFPTLKLTSMLKQHLARAGERLPRPLMNAETQLLRKEIEQGIASTFDKAIVDSTFTHKFASIINQSPRPVGEHNYRDLIRSLSAPGHGLIFKHARNQGGVLVVGEPPATGLPDAFLQFPVNPQALHQPSNRLRVHLTRHLVGHWDRAAVPVPDSEISNLAWMVEHYETDIRCIVAVDGGVIVIFRVDAHDFESWQAECKRISSSFARCDVQLGKFSMHTLIPFSRHSRGRGALLYLSN